MKSITLIGSGNLATHLGLTLKKQGFIITQVFSRKKNNALQLAKKLNSEYTDNINHLISSDLMILCIKDDAIKSILTKIKTENIIHTSGTLNINIFQKKFKNYGIIYPLQTFKKNIKTNFSNVPICIEANNIEFQKKLIKLSNKISNKVYEINSSQRKKIHLAAVFACNFSNHMYAIAEEILKEDNIDKSILLPLIKETAKKVEKKNAKEMQTGPAIRKDTETIKEHLNSLNNLSYKKIYKLISSNIQQNE